mgnify:CR=1 FL=1
MTTLRPLARTRVAGAQPPVPPSTESIVTHAAAAGRSRRLPARGRRSRSAAGGPWGRIVAGVVVAAAVLFALLPVASLVLTSLKGPADILALRVFPAELAWSNWSSAFERFPITTYLANSFAVAGLATLVALVIAIPANYAIARLRAGGGSALGTIVSVYIAPPVVAVVPLFLLVRTLGLMDSILGLALVEALVIVPVVVWLLDGFFRAVPEEIDEAAALDGCGPVRTLVRIVLPLVMPGVVAVAIIGFVLVYNDFLIPVILTQSADSQTLPVGISLMQGGREVMFGQMAAASLTGMVPVYVLALLLQRWLVGGLTQGSVK